MGSMCTKPNPVVEIKPDIHGNTASTNCFDNDEFTCPSSCCIIQIQKAPNIVQNEIRDVMKDVSKIVDPK